MFTCQGNITRKLHESNQLTLSGCYLRTIEQSEFSLCAYLAVLRILNIFSKNRSCKGYKSPVGIVPRWGKATYRDRNIVLKMEIRGRGLIEGKKNSLWK